MSGVAPGVGAKRLTEAAYDVLLEALAVFYWYRSDFEGFVRAALEEAPELVAPLDFEEPKRKVAAQLVRSMRRGERYQDLTIDLLMKMSEFDARFPRLARLDDGAAKVAAAQAALQEVQRVVAHHKGLVTAREQVLAEAAARAEADELRRSHANVLVGLKDRFLELHAMTDAHGRGRRFESLLNNLFVLFDLYPRASYNIEHEQIDGAFTFDTDDYLLEAKWWATPLEPHHLHVLKAKIDTKAKHVMGLFVAVNGFTSGAIEKYSHGTPLILMDGADLYAVLEGRISLTEVLHRKRRHAAETGSPMLSVTRMIG